MKVLTVGSDRKIFEGGSEVRARVIEYGALFDELHIIIFSPKIQENVYKIGPNVFVYPTNSLSRWFYVWDAISVGKKILAGNSRIKNWVLTAQDPFESGLVVYKLAKWFGMKFQLQIHTDFLSPYFLKETRLNRIRLWIARWIIPHADGFRVVGEKIRRSLVARFSVDSSKVTVLPIFVDIEKIKDATISVDLRKKYPKFEKIILMVTRLAREKNVDFAINIFSEVVKSFPKAGLVIVGSGRGEEKLESKVRNCGLQEKVMFEGFQEKEIVYSYYKTSDLFLQTSVYEGYGLAFIEALAFGIPIVSSNVGVATEITQSKQSLAICPVNDRDCFIKEMERLLEKGSKASSTMIGAEEGFFLTKAQYLAKYQQALKTILS